MKKTSAKYIALAAAAATACAALPIGAFAEKNGDITGSYLYTDIIAYIDSLPIRSYNIAGYTAVIVEDLEDYGFDVVWDAEKRALYASRDASETASGEYAPQSSGHKNGDYAGDVYYTDIVAYFDGAAVKSFNIGGRTAVYADDIARMYGSSYVWDESARTLSLTLGGKPAPAVSGETIQSSDPAAVPSQDQTPPDASAAPSGVIAPPSNTQSWTSQTAAPGTVFQPGTPPSDIQQGQQAQQMTPPSGASFQMPMGGMGSQYTLASEPSEIVYGISENSAMQLEADYENAETITMSGENSEVKISSAGTYIITGSYKSGSVTVKKGTTGVVLILQDLTLSSSSGAPVSINKETEVKVIISGTVTLTDAENPDDEYSTDADTADAYDGAAIKAKADSTVYITGSGTLNINSAAKNGIKAGDNSSLIIDGVTINITAANDAINANYDLAILGGTFNISAADDAIHADHILTVGASDGTGPEINVTSCVEGLEGTVVNILGGNISLTCSDDAVNAANSDGTYIGELTYSINMLGGVLNVKCSGDGLDSNGNINLISGSAAISSAAAGGEAGIDYDGQLYISDGFVLDNAGGIAGPDGMGMGMGGQPGMGGMAPGGQNGGFPGGGFPGNMPIAP